MRTKKKSRLPAIILAILLLILVAAGTYLAVTWPGPSRLLPVAAHAVYKRPDWAPRDRNVELLQYDKQAAIRDDGIVYYLPPSDITAWHEFETQVTITWRFEIKLPNGNVIEDACGDPIVPKNAPDVSILETGRKRYYVSNENLTLIPLL